MSADVQSIDAIERFRHVVLKFAEQCELGIEEIVAETRRMIDWLEHDRPHYWRQQVHKAHDDVHQARINLQRCLSYSYGSERPSCQEERAALKQAEARLDYCRDKVERVKHWCREVQHEMLEFQGRITQLTSCIEIDVPRAVAVLGRIVDQLAAYREAQSSGSRSAATSGRASTTIDTQSDLPQPDSQAAPTDQSALSEPQDPTESE
jgi:hypothetical protein